MEEHVVEKMAFVSKRRQTDNELNKDVKNYNKLKKLLKEEKNIDLPEFNSCRSTPSFRIYEIRGCNEIDFSFQDILKEKLDFMVNFQIEGNIEGDFTINLSVMKTMFEENPINATPIYQVVNPTRSDVSNNKQSTNGKKKFFGIFFYSIIFLIFSFYLYYKYNQIEEIENDDDTFNNIEDY
jgi:hypothetical protein